MVTAPADYNVAVLPFVALTLVALAALLVAEQRKAAAAVWIAKPLASTGFIGAALAAGALDSVYGRWILGGLILSWIGDVLLIPRGANFTFRAGALSFLLGHIAYAAAFTLRGIAGAATFTAALAVAMAAGAVGMWLRMDVPVGMRGLVYGYLVAISAMVVLAAGAAVASGVPMILGGALLFYVSDIAVARDRFVASGFSNKLWGLPLYYGGQLLLASTVS